jgi:DNA processing protein
VPFRDDLWDELERDRDIVSQDGTADVGAAEPTSARDRVKALIGIAAVAIDDIARQADLPVRTVQTALVDLELAGEIDRHPGNVVSRAVLR